MPAAIIGGAIAGVGAIGAAAIGSKAQKKAAQTAADATAQATAENNALQREIYGSNKQTLDPYIQSGYSANNAIAALLGTGGTPADKTAYENAFANYQKSSGYQFRMNEGNKALNASFAARGLADSGAAVKGALSFGQNIASDEFGRYLGALSQQQGVGLSAGGALAGVSTNYANNVAAQNNASAGVAANAALASGQASAALYGTAAGALGNIGGQLISSYRAPTPGAYGIAGSGGIY